MIQFLNILASFGVISVFYFGHSGSVYCYLIWVLISISLIAREVEHMCLFDIFHILSKFLFVSFVYLFFYLDCLFIVEYWELGFLGFFFGVFGNLFISVYIL